MRQTKGDEFETFTFAHEINSKLVHGTYNNDTNKTNQ